MDFEQFVQAFPTRSDRLWLGEGAYLGFEREAMLLPEVALPFLADLEQDLDEFTEILPVGRFSRKRYTALVYWKAGLMHNHYRLVTFDASGQMIDERVVAGTYYDPHDSTKTSLAVIDAELNIFIVTGPHSDNEELGNALDNVALRLTVNEAGLIKNYEAEPLEISEN